MGKVEMQRAWPAGDPDLAAKVAFLRQPGAYPEPVARVQEIETHMSWLFLTDDHVYKLKKPFRRNGIDYGTPTARRLNCLRELRLNQRLAPDVYLDVLDLTRDALGQLAIGGPGRRIDSLLRMRRLPNSMTLEEALRTGRARAGDARRIVARLAPFFAAARRARLTASGYRRRLSQGIAAVTVQLQRPEFGLPPGEASTLAAALQRFISGQGDLLDERARAGRIVEGHGDLRPEHIYLTVPPTIIDCIEFDRDLRLRDPVDELAFLAMECDRCGRPEMDGWLFDAHAALAGDPVPRALVEFYKAMNAFKRARIAVWHIEDPETGPASAWTARGKDYLDHARRYLARLPDLP